MGKLLAFAIMFFVGWFLTHDAAAAADASSSDVVSAVLGGVNVSGGIMGMMALWIRDTTEKRNKESAAHAETIRVIKSEHRAEIVAMCERHEERLKGIAQEASSTTGKVFALVERLIPERQKEGG